MTECQLQLPTYEEMIKSGMHFGRKRTVFNPNMSQFVYTLKENIYILDLIKTTEFLTQAVNFLKQSLSEGKMILFVGLTKQSADITKSVAETLNMPFVTERWLGGTLTNFKTIISRVKHLEELEKAQTEGSFDKFTKHERMLKEREITNLRRKFDGIRKLTRVPDIVFVTSLKESQLPVREAKNVKVKIVGIVNTDSDPKQIDYPIPANDNARKSVELILKTIERELSKPNGEKSSD